MNSINTPDALFPDCPIRNVLSRISDKWSLLILFTLSNQQHPMRFGQLQRAIPDISHKVLTSTLRVLQEDGYVHRKAYAEVPPRVEYALTERAHTLLPHLYALIEWATGHFAAIMHDREASR